MRRGAKLPDRVCAVDAVDVRVLAAVVVLLADEGGHGRGVFCQFRQIAVAADACVGERGLGVGNA